MMGDLVVKLEEICLTGTTERRGLMKLREGPCLFRALDQGCDVDGFTILKT
jgi:hypothetical protein